MLLPINSDTTYSKTFKLLNDELDFFLRSCVTAEAFGKELFSESLADAIYENEPTREKFYDMWNELHKLQSDEKETIATIFHDSKSINSLFNDVELSLPIYPERITLKFKELCTHLFKQTKSLVDIERCSGEKIIEHFNHFRSLNGNVCYICGTDELAPIQENIEEDEQWIADYDHLLCKKTFPFFGINPENLWPTCITCNRRAKGSKKLLVDDNGERKFSFYPKDEILACKYVSIIITEGETDSILRVRLDIFSEHAILNSKLSTWNDVYKIVDRVEGHYRALAECLDLELSSQNYADFCSDISHKIEAYKRNIKTKPWVFWNLKLLSWINDNAGEPIKKGLWGILEASKNSSNQDDFESVFGI